MTPRLVRQRLKWWLTGYFTTARLKTLNDAFDAGCYAGCWWFLGRLMLVRYDRGEVEGAYWSLFLLPEDEAEAAKLYSEFREATCK